jgi:DNA-binding transcriptional ArsR family regulator
MIPATGQAEEMSDEQPDIPNEDTTLTANALKAMAHPLRWKILCTLGDRELSVGEIVEQTGTSQSNISQHLDQLRNKNILVSRKEANRIYYKIRNSQLLDLIGTMRNVLCPTNLNDSYPPE